MIELKDLMDWRYLREEKTNLIARIPKILFFVYMSMSENEVNNILNVLKHRKKK